MPDVVPDADPAPNAERKLSMMYGIIHMVKLTSTLLLLNLLGSGKLVRASVGDASGNGGLVGSVRADTRYIGAREQD